MMSTTLPDSAPPATGAQSQPPSPVDWGVFGPGRLPELIDFFRRQGFAILRGAMSDADLEALQADLIEWQDRLVAGELDPRHGTVILDEPDARIDGRPFAHYVCEVTLLSKPADALAHHPAIRQVVTEVLGPQAWLLDDDRFGVVYQDARPGAESGYTRIGWHSDAQSGPTLDMWPSVSFTAHLDATSPANGFLRVLPGSHLGGTDGMPPGFEKVPGEVAVYAERGDILFHHCDVWHSAARATDEGDGKRRHLRGSWYGGQRLQPGHGTDDFVKNARR